jgi:aspartyl-tRNA(Asn)/glutamyl-tRNA(Gln) amidotransferase subunit A
MLTQLSLKDTHQKLKNKEVSCKELTQAYFDRIKLVDDKLNSYVCLNEEGALKQAEEIDTKGSFENPLMGIPISLKDSFCSTETPWDTSRVPGGSSGGPATATAADLNTFSLGTDTGGSIRQPASMCGCVGFKPTYGRISRFGVIAMSSSLDTVGTLNKTVEDAAIILNAMAGHDVNDLTTAKKDVPDYTANLNQDIKGMKIGIPKEFYLDGMESGVQKAVEEAIETLKKMGAEIVEVSIPHAKYTLSVYHTIVPLEVSANMARYDGIRYGLKGESPEDLIDTYKKVRNAGFGEEVKRRIAIGRLIDAIGYSDKYYSQARKVQALIRQDFNTVFESVDALVTPTSMMVAFKIGEKIDDPMKMYMSDLLVNPASVAAMPAVSVPCGFSKNMPVGLQFIGKQWDEETVLRVGHQYQLHTDWHTKKPSL